MPELLRRWLAPLLFILLFTGCLPDEPRPLDHQVYIWQRQWRPAHADALAASRADFSTLRVLALQAHPKAGWARAYPDLELLRRDGRPLVAVVRLDGQLPQLDTRIIPEQIARLLRDWRAAGIAVQGLEIDHDCATARLPAYAELLREVRRQLPTEVKLSITALPAWLTSGELDGLLTSVDSSVLQVHAVSNPRDGLFDPRQAQDWAEEYAARTSKPFYLALPAYGIAVLDLAGATPVVESEARLNAAGTRHELMADPQQVADLLDELHRAPPPHLSGILWFRLPLAGDRRAWPLVTLQAVRHQQPLRSDVQVQLSLRGATRELQLRNLGSLASQLPKQISVNARDCDASDALGAYRVQRSSDGLLFTRQHDGQLAAGSQRALGWARCRTIVQGAIHVQF